jgi:hypothetical protein
VKLWGGGQPVPSTGLVQVDGAKLCAAEVDAFEPGAAEIGTKEVSHTRTVTSCADESVPTVRAMGGQEGPTVVAVRVGRDALRRGDRR